MNSVAHDFFSTESTKVLECFHMLIYCTFLCDNGQFSNQLLFFKKIVAIHYVYNNYDTFTSSISCFVVGSYGAPSVKQTETGGL